MSPRRLIVFAVVAVALLGIALWYTGERRPAQESTLREPLLPAFGARLNDIERVRIVGAGDAVIATLERGEAGWTLAERDAFPADAGKLRELLIALAEARRIEAKTSNPELHYKLGLEDVAVADAGGVRVDIEGEGGPWSVIVGDNRSSGNGNYVRLAEQPQAWLVDRNIPVERSTANWLQRDLLDIDVERIVEVEVQPPSGAAVRIERSEDDAGDFRLANVPRGREPASAYVADSTAGLLSALRVDDVLAADAVEVDQATQRTANFLTREGVRIDLSSWQRDGKTYARFDAAFDESQAERFIAASQAEQRASFERQQAEQAERDAATAQDGAADAAAAESTADELAPVTPLAVSDPEADRRQRIELAQEEVEQLDAKFGDRVFVLPSFKAANLNRDLEEYLKPKG